MKDTKTKERFVELRAEGWSYERIAQELQVSKPTLIDWSKGLSRDIVNLGAIRLEALREQYGLTQQAKLEQLGESLKLIGEELSRRKLDSLTVKELLELRLKYLERLDKVAQAGLCFSEQGIYQQELWVA
jgi:transcriptional regulator with XRE-family HTH domain